MSSPKTVVIMGGSIAGLCTAAAIAPLFDQVIILDRDHPPKKIGEVPFHQMGRAQTPQDQHIHLLLKQGSDTIESFLPGFAERLKVNGASIMNITGDMVMNLHGKWMKNEHSQYLDSLLITRPIIEQTIRDMVFEKYPNIQMVWNARVMSYQLDSNSSSTSSFFSSSNRTKKMVSIKYQLTGRNAVSGEKNSTESQSQLVELSADLFIDAMGFSSPTARYLSIHAPSLFNSTGATSNNSDVVASGSQEEQPQKEDLETTSVHMNLRYSTTFIRTNANNYPTGNSDSTKHLKRLYIKPDKDLCGGVFFQLPNGTTQVTLMGYHHQRPDELVRDKKSFLEYVHKVNDLVKSEYDIIKTFITGDFEMNESNDMKQMNSADEIETELKDEDQSEPEAESSIESESVTEQSEEDVAKTKEPQVEIVFGPKPFSVRTQILKRWDLCDKIPDNLVIIGDAFCRFDPAFGQGMTVAALEAKQVRDMLAYSMYAKPQMPYLIPQSVLDVIMLPLFMPLFIISWLFFLLSSFVLSARRVFQQGRQASQEQVADDTHSHSQQQQHQFISSKRIMASFVPIAFVPFFIDTIEAWRYSSYTTGWKPYFLPLIHMVLDRVLEASSRDGKVYQTLMSIFNMVSYTSILHPRILTKIFMPRLTTKTD